MLFIEVKGGMLQRETRFLGRILSNGRIRKLSKSPFDQCSFNMFKLLDRIEKERPFIGRGKLPFTFGYTVAFPHSRRGLVVDGTHRDLVYDSKCEDLKRSIQAGLRPLAPVPSFLGHPRVTFAFGIQVLSNSG